MPTTHFAPTLVKMTGASLGSAPLISALALGGVPEFVREAFGPRVLRKANQAAMLNVELIANQDFFIPQSVMTIFVDEVAKASGEADFGMMLAPHADVASYGCWGEYLLGAQTLGVALKCAVSTIGLHSRGDAMTMSIENGIARISYLSAVRGRDGYSHVACGSIGGIISLCRSYLPAGWKPLSVELDIERPRFTECFERGFCCDVIFDAPAASVFVSATDLQARRPHSTNRPTVTIEDVGRARLERVGSGTLLDIVAEQVRAQVVSGSVSIEGAARALDTSVRTLQRQLNREGSDFRSVASAVRIQRALELLRGSNRSISQISVDLGYSAPAHFTRAFGKATGQSPHNYRRNLSLTQNGKRRSAS